MFNCAVITIFKKFVFLTYYKQNCLYFFSEKKKKEREFLRYLKNQNEKRGFL